MTDSHAGGMAAICAKETAAVDVKRTVPTAAVDIAFGRKARVGRTAETGGIADVQPAASKRVLAATPLDKPEVPARSERHYDE
jgi:hypothetical protein